MGMGANILADIAMGAAEYGGKMLKGEYRSFEGSEALTGQAAIPKYMPYNFPDPFRNAGGGGGGSHAAQPGNDATYTPGRGFRPGGGPIQATYTRPGPQATIPSGPSPNALSSQLALPAGGTGVAAKIGGGGKGLGSAISVASKLL